MGFPENLKALRKQRGVTQKQLAEHLGVSSSLFAMYETGKRKPSFEMLCTLGGYFGVRINELVDSGGQRATAAEVFHTLLYCAGFSEALDDDANWTVYKEGVSVDMHEEKVSRIMAQTLQYFTYLVERER